MIVDGLYKGQCGCLFPIGTNGICPEHGAWIKPPCFSEWWKETYEGKLGSPAIEASFREVAAKAWNAAIDSERDMHDVIREALKQPGRRA